VNLEYGKVEQETEYIERGGVLRLSESTDVARLAALTADEKKAKEVRILNIRSISSVADYFVICSGTNTAHLRSIADNIKERLTSRGVSLHHVEGYRAGRWILLDYGDVVVHIMQEEERSFYHLERLWGDAQELVMPRSEAG
jgi:ribosome-associated protein